MPKRFPIRLSVSTIAVALSMTVAGTAAPSVATPQAGGRAGNPAALPSRPNIVFILTDDQRWDELQYMPDVQSLLQAHGVTFPNGFVSNPLCCPARATILTGLYSGNDGVWTNKAKDHGGYETFHQLGEENHTVATVLHDDGYYTGLIGKYLNGYNRNDATWVPPGWDSWNALTDFDYFGPTESVDGTYTQYSQSQYQTDILGQQAVSFIDGAPSGQPLFLYWAVHAPHLPSTPAPQDQGTLARSLQPWRPASYDEADVSDKPWYVQRAPLWSASKEAHWDRVREDMYESLIDVDRWVGSIVSALQADGRLSNTLIVFTSDNGFLLGEHRRTGKVVPYEESLRVPWIVRWDAADLPEAGGTDGHLMLNTDFAGTFADVAGTTMGQTDGLDFANLAASPSTYPWRTDFLIEHGGTTDAKGDARGITYCGVRSTGYMYTQYWNGFEELYDLTNDPSELQNQAQNPGYASTLGDMRSRAHQLCDPPPPGFAWTH